MINIGVIGYGYWGPNIVRNFYENSEARVCMIAEKNSDRLALAKQRYPTIKLTNDPAILIKNHDIDAVVIATPVSTHYSLAKQAIDHGKHVLIEKPMAETAEQSQNLIESASSKNVVLMIDHTFVYMGAVEKIKHIINNGELGHVFYYDSTRVNLGLFQHDVNVVYDLAVHDLSIMDYLFDGLSPIAIRAVGKCHFQDQSENLAYISLFFDTNFIAHINVNWLSPVKLRKIMIGGSKKMIIFDDLEATEKVKIYDSGITINTSAEDLYKTLIDYRTGDVLSPTFDRTEALKKMSSHFLHCIHTRATPITDGLMGVRIVKILEAATKSLHSNGGLIHL